MTSPLCRHQPTLSVHLIVPHLHRDPHQLHRPAHESFHGRDLNISSDVRKLHRLLAHVPGSLHCQGRESECAICMVKHNLPESHPLALLSPCLCCSMTIARFRRRMHCQKLRRGKRAAEAAPVTSFRRCNSGAPRALLPTGNKGTVAMLALCR